MRRLAAAVLVALAVPAASQAKGLSSLAVCGPDGCQVARTTGSGEVWDMSRTVQGPPPGPYYELRLSFEHGGQSTGLYYEPRSGLASYSESFGVRAWAPLLPLVATAVKDAAKRVEAYPAPNLTAVYVGDRRVKGDTSTYLALFGATGPFAVPSPRAELAWIRLESPDSNPWTETPLAFYPEDGVLLTGMRYVKLPAAVAADVAAARPLAGPGNKSARLPSIAIGTAIAGVFVLVLLVRRRRSAREVAPVH